MLSILLIPFKFNNALIYILHSWSQGSWQSLAAGPLEVEAFLHEAVGVGGALQVKLGHRDTTASNLGGEHGRRVDDAGGPHHQAEVAQLQVLLCLLREGGG